MNAAAAGSDFAGLRDQPYELLAALETRLREARPDTAAGPTPSWAGLAFRTGTRWLLAPHSEVREVIPRPGLTRVPGAKPFLLGLANVRGGLVPVTELATFFGQARTSEHRGQRVLVYNSERMPAGFLVDEVSGYRQFAPSDQRHERVREAGALEPYLLGAFVREGREWWVLSLHRLVRAGLFLNAAE
jgi:twitching motility protein PilI